MNPIKAFVEFVNQNQKNGMVVAEVGVYDGATTKEYVNIIKENEGKLYVIDWFMGNENVTGYHQFDETKKNSVLDTFKNNVSYFLDIIEILDGKSEDMISFIPDNSLDICFIDADHRYTNVYNDIKMLLPKIKKGGFICGHDLEDINLAITSFDPEWLEKDYVNGAHWGVIKAVYDHFGNDIQVIPDPMGQKIPIWIKQL